MKTHELELIKTIDELNDRNNMIRVEYPGCTMIYSMWDFLDIEEVKG